MGSGLGSSYLAPDPFPPPDPGAVAYNANKTDATMANPETGYFTNESTAIQHIGTEEEGIQSIYTLQGKRVREAWKHLPAGVYVVNGKKIIK